MPPSTLLQRARREGVPLVDQGEVTFLWQGDDPPVVIGDFNDWERGAPLAFRPAGRGLWAARHAFPPEAYIEYALMRGEERLRDPLNSRVVSNGMGKYNHYFYMPAAPPATLHLRHGGATRGQVDRHSLPTYGLLAGDERAVYLYQPPVDSPSPLLVVWDGQDYHRRARLPVILDNLLAARRIRPVALAMVANGKAARTVEYACSESPLGFLSHVLLPYARERLNLVDVSRSPGAFSVMGASMGGLMALYTALRMPEVFGGVLSQSGAFSLFEHDMPVFDLLTLPRRLPLRAWLEVGLYDIYDLLPANRRMKALLDEQGFAPGYWEYPAGHNYTAWRRNLWRGLEYLFGGKDDR